MKSKSNSLREDERAAMALYDAFISYSHAKGISIDYDMYYLIDCDVQII
jgi:hypothetical protein